MNTLEKFQADIENRLEEYSHDAALDASVIEFTNTLNRVKYAYNFFWLGRPIIQLPQDLQAFQEIIWEVKPDLIIETGIAHGGSLMFSASMIALLEYTGEIEHGDVLGLDIDIRKENKEAILAHPLSKKITMYEGSSVDPEIVVKVKDFAKDKKRIMVFLDSNHTHEHVLNELRAYAPLVTLGSYCIVADTGVEDIDQSLIGDRPWGRGNSPKSALREYLNENDAFVIEKHYEQKILITGSSDGYLKRVK
ncbi:MAG: cephalosporin hydroxylase family protein [Sulfurimonadaceae bacterium]|jgi:cephalosporin hydroxylase